MGLPAYALPAGFAGFPPAVQVLVLSNLDRAVYGLTPITGLNAALNSSALRGASGDADPSGLPIVDGQASIGWTSNWAAGWASALYTYYEWMYEDGPGSGNLDCPAGGGGGCWGHRQDTLSNFGAGNPVAMGFGASTSPTYHTPAFTELYEAFRPGANPTYVPTVTGVSRTSGSGGLSETITGYGFVGVVGVHFGDWSAPFQVVSANSINTTVPSGYGSVGIWVMTYGGSSASIAGDMFAYTTTAPSSGVSIGSQLTAGHALSIGQDLQSADGRFSLRMQADGNLIEYAVSGNRPLWETNTAGSGAQFLDVQTDFNIVLYAAGGRPVWNSGARAGQAGTASLVLQSDGNLVLYGAKGAAWAANSFPYQLTRGTSLTAGQSVTSADRRLSLSMQADGNLVLYGPAGALWSSGTAANPYSRAVLQTDGNFVIYRADGVPLWYTSTRNPLAALVTQNDGNEVLYGSGLAEWSTRTHA